MPTLRHHRRTKSASSPSTGTNHKTSLILVNNLISLRGRAEHLVRDRNLPSTTAESRDLLQPCSYPFRNLPVCPCTACERSGDGSSALSLSQYLQESTGAACDESSNLTTIRMRDHQSLAFGTGPSVMLTDHVRPSQRVQNPRPDFLVYLFILFDPFRLQTDNLAYSQSLVGVRWVIRVRVRFGKLVEDTGGRGGADGSHGLDTYRSTDRQQGACNKRHGE
jgi:hypothetical protein